MTRLIHPIGMRPPSIRTGIAAIALAGVAACATGRTSAPDTGLATMGPEAAKARARADSVRHPYTEADIRFMSTMISHHAQAIAMSSWAPSHGASPAVIRLTERIINAQTDEIAMMSRWLQDRNQPVPESNPAGMKMMMAGEEHMMLMPGMLSVEQMKQLDAARGPEFDRLFLTFMIQHHRGAIVMVQELISHHDAAQDEAVFKFAADVNVDQTTEVNRMLDMLLVAR
ncbi:MAG TPA: DUF305 domain-containing protein [Gemmatimonadaceae bacterium]|nr:DUF305 domain-containing protein [Gemmatimonadaceae bacterium]